VAYTVGVSVPAELSSSLPPTLDPTRIRAAVRGSGSPGTLGGETWIVDVDGALAVLTRRSIFDPLQPISLAAEAPLVQRERELEVRPAIGEPFVVRPSFFEIEAVTQLLAGVAGLADTATPATAAAAAPTPVGGAVTTRSVLGPLDSSAPARSRAGAQAGAGVEQVAALIAQDASADALALARRQLDQTSGDAADRWRDLVRALERLDAGELVDALVWARASVELPDGVNDSFYLRLATALEHAGEPLLAWAALEEMHDGAPGAAQRARLDSQLPDDEIRWLELERRVRDRLLGPAQDDDPWAQRALAQALLRLDELGPALMWIRRARHGDPHDVFARELELEILRQRLIDDADDHDDRPLLAAIDSFTADFPDAALPWTVRAEHHQYDDPPRAIEALREALRREFSALALRDLAELLASQGRHRELVRTVEDAFANHADELAEYDFVTRELHAKLGVAQAALRGAAASSAAIATNSPAGSRALGVAVVVLLFLIGLAVAVLGAA
jgi:tetratricopeptide (TPR) repeat protein